MSRGRKRNVSAPGWNLNDRTQASPRQLRRASRSGKGPAQIATVGAAQDVAQRRGDQRYPARDGHFGAVKDHAVGPREPRSEQPEGPRGIEQDEFRLMALDGGLDGAIRAPARGRTMSTRRRVLRQRRSTSRQRRRRPRATTPSARRRARARGGATVREGRPGFHRSSVDSRWSPEGGGPWDHASSAK